MKKDTPKIPLEHVRSGLEFRFCLVLRVFNLSSPSVRRVVCATAKAIFLCVFFSFLGLFSVWCFNMYIARYWLTLILCGLASATHTVFVLSVVFSWRILVVRFCSSEQAHIFKYVFHKCMRNEIEYADDDEGYAKKMEKKTQCRKPSAAAVPEATAAYMNIECMNAKITKRNVEYILCEQSTMLSVTDLCSQTHSTQPKRIHYIVHAAQFTALSIYTRRCILFSRCLFRLHIPAISAEKSFFFLRSWNSEFMWVSRQRRGRICDEWICCSSVIEKKNDMWRRVVDRAARKKPKKKKNGRQSTLTKHPIIRPYILQRLNRNADLIAA